MGNLVDNKFTWVIQNFNSLQSNKIYSDPFVIGGCKWKLLVSPKGDKVDYLSLYLTVDDNGLLPCGWKRHAKYSLTLVNQLSERLSRKKVGAQQWFDAKAPSWGFETMLLQTSLHERDSGFLVNGELKISVEVDVLEEGFEVSGFFVLPSQVDSVKHIFGKYPDMALNCRAKNQILKTSCMNVILSLIETLCQSPQELSGEDMVEADNALAYVKDSGFKVDWLEKKLEEVKKKKEDEQIGETQIQELELELKDFKQKWSDIEAQLKKEKAKVLAAKASLTLDDFV